MLLNPEMGNGNYENEFYLDFPGFFMRGDRKGLKDKLRNEISCWHWLLKFPSIQ